MTFFVKSFHLQDTIINPTPKRDSIVSIPANQLQSSDSSLHIAVPKKKVAISSTETEFVVKSKEDILIEPVKTQTKKEQWNSAGNFFQENALTGKVKGFINDSNKIVEYSQTTKPVSINVTDKNSYAYDWLLGIFLLLVILFVWIRIFYSKFFSALANALISFHLSVKLFQEKNVLLHRVSIILDFIYIIVFSVFLFEIIEHFRFSASKMTGFNLFLLLFNIIILYVLLRILVLRLTGALFLAQPLFAEYIHNTNVVNKGLGIALFPIVIMIQYLPVKLIPIVLWIGIIILCFAILYKTIRAYQIIIRRDILLFYLILYLCTLEILPLLLGYKFVTTLIQSN